MRDLRGTSCLSRVTIASAPVTSDGPPPPTSPPDPPPGLLLTVVGIGADGIDGLPDRLRALVLDADIVLGGRRHLDLLPVCAGQVREPWPSPLRDGVEELVRRHTGRAVVALASGDPLLAGVGTTLVELLGADAVRVEPAVSSVTLARARMRWSAEGVEVVNLVGRPVATLVRALSPGGRVLVLSADERTPREVATLLVAHGYAASRLTVLGDLGSADEARSTGLAGSWDQPSPRLHVLALELDGPAAGSLLAGLPDSAYDHDGQLTKRDLRASALSRLAPQPGQLLWDVGAGAGSVGIEWMRSHPNCRTVAVEVDPERAERVARNAAALGVPSLSVVHGRAPDALAGLPAPDAVFVGGGATRPGVLDACLAALRPGGRLVVHGVTLETETLLAGAYAEHGGELTRLSVEHAEPIGTFTGWAPARAVTQWTWEKP